MAPHIRLELYADIENLTFQNCYYNRTEEGSRKTSSEQPEL